ncbi:LacI family transcriptional regulator [Thermus sp. LT1-2-5]|uniref:LacI family DNA-binding transcriptional regulator n=1 Tax=Thermus sp. LT1-2-5 TaxID=3026935 RepID=UPI0030E882B1
MPTLRDVARLAGVSHTTVSHVLNGTKQVRSEVADRVWAAVETLGYRLNRQAQALRRGHSHTLGLVLPDLTNPFFPGLAQAIGLAARKAGYTLTLVDSLGDEGVQEEGLHRLAEEQVAGAIWVPVGVYTPPPFPVVLVDRTVEGTDGVEADHYLGGRLQARHALALGHRRVGLLIGPQSLRSARLRREGFLAEAQLGGLEVVWEEEVPFGLELSSGAQARLRRARDEVSLVVAANDVIAVTALRVLREAGIRVPEEVSLIGYDDIPWSTLAFPSLTTIRQPVKEMAEAAVALLLRRLREPTAEAVRVVLPVTLIPRESAREVR